MIEIDMEQDTVSFCFNTECEELQDFCDITLQRNGEPGEFGGTRFEAAADWPAECRIQPADVNEGGRWRKEK